MPADGSLELPDAPTPLLLAAACRAALLAAGRADPIDADPALVAQLRVSGDPSVWLGRVHESVAARDAPSRASRGAFYTPADWVAEAVDPVLDALLTERDPADLRVVDPACGAGAFLLHAYDRLHAHLLAIDHPNPAAAALACLHGVDHDAWAVRLTRLALALRSAQPLHAPRVHHGDALLGPTPSSPGTAHTPSGVPTLDWTRLAAFDAVIGNPPFLGGKRMIPVLGRALATALRSRRGLSGNADLAAHFLHLSAEILSPGGHLALWTTDTIAQGETRRHGLGRLTPDALTLVRAVRTRRWRGDASVYIALVHAVKGPAEPPFQLDGRRVARISSHLRSDVLDEVPPARPEPHPPAFIGCDLKGPGFLFGDAAGHSLTSLERLRRTDPRLDEVVRPYVTGRTLTRSLDGTPQRLVADLHALDLDQARERHPELLKLLERSVKPDRAQRTRAVARVPWWRFFRTRPALRQALQGLDRCLTAGVITQHLVWRWQPTDRVFSHKVVVVATQDDFLFGALQCRLHDHWARALSSTFGGGLNYAPSRCYRTYPLPIRSEAVARAARSLIAVRTRTSHTTGLGPGPLQSRLHADDPAPELQHLRKAQQALDRAMLQAWGWSDLDLDDPDEVIARLLRAPSSS